MPIDLKTNEIDLALHIKKIATCGGHRAAIYALAPGRNERHFLTGGGDGWIVEWNMDDPENGKLVASIEDRVFSLCRLPGPNRLVAGNMTGGVHWIDLDDPTQTLNVQHHSNKGVFEILSIGQSVFTVGGDGFVTRWDAATRRTAESLQLSGQALRALSYSEQRGELAIGASDHSIYVLDIQSFEVKKVIRGAHSNSVFAVSWSPDGLRLVSGGRDAMLKICDASDDFALGKALPAHLFTINNMAWSPDGRLLATASRDKTVKIWDAATFELLKVIDSMRAEGHLSSANRLLWLPDALVSCSDDWTAIIWSVEVR